MKSHPSHLLRSLVVCLLLAASASIAGAAERQLRLNAALGAPVMLAGEKQLAYLKVGLTGFSLDDESDRRPVNLAIVLDKSGSMQGEKIAKAREAAIQAISRLNRDDIISVVLYDSNVQTLIPATKAVDKESICEKIRRVQAGSNTALFAGVSKGAEEARKFLSRNTVNSIILLSDGLANVGPSSPGELGRLGASLGGEGITVSTIGLGLDYNEDLMTQLAMNSDGNHFFVENAEDLAQVFDKEFGKAMSVVAQNVRIHIQCGDGVRPVRALNRDAEISGSDLVVHINQVYGGQEKFLILEMEVSPGSAGQSLKAATVDVTYENLATEKKESLSRPVELAFTASKDEVTRRTDNAVMADAIEMIGVLNVQSAMALRDQGRIEEARRAYFDNGAFLGDNAAKYDSDKLTDFSAKQEGYAKDVEGPEWNRSRKMQSAGNVYRQMQ